MPSKRSFTLYLLLFILTPIIVFYILGGEMASPYSGDGSTGICLVSILSGPVTFYVVYWARNKFFSKNIEFSKINTDDPEESYPNRNRSKKRKKGGVLDNIFSSENECDTCGTEMEYKEGMDSYYCPECHEYK